MSRLYHCGATMPPEMLAKLHRIPIDEVRCRLNAMGVRFDDTFLPQPVHEGFFDKIEPITAFLAGSILGAGWMADVVHGREVALVRVVLPSEKHAYLRALADSVGFRGSLRSFTYGPTKEQWDALHILHVPRWLHRLWSSWGMRYGILRAPVSKPFSRAASRFSHQFLSGLLGAALATQKGEEIKVLGWTPRQVCSISRGLVQVIGSGGITYTSSEPVALRVNRDLALSFLDADPMRSKLPSVYLL